jgi:hypothetical protein
MLKQLLYERLTILYFGFQWFININVFKLFEKKNVLCYENKPLFKNIFIFLYYLFRGCCGLKRGVDSFKKVCFTWVRFDIL